MLLLDRGAGLEVPNRRGMVPLLSAAKHGHTQVTRHTECNCIARLDFLMDNLYNHSNKTHIRRAKTLDLQNHHFSRDQNNDILVEPLILHRQREQVNFDTLDFSKMCQNNGPRWELTNRINM